MSDLDNIEYLIKALENEKCILLLGPEINNLTDEISIEKALADYLKNKGISLSYYDKEKLFLFDEGTSRGKLSHEIKQFYDLVEIPPIYDLIARIPFHLVISITPDLFLKKVFDNNNFTRDVSIYSKVENPAEIIKPSKESPLLYYLFGSYELLNSLVLTHDDLFNFIDAILSKHELPLELINSMLDIENFIFLGFRFDHWYVQILMRYFDSKIRSTYTKFTIDRFALSRSVNETTKAFFINEFNMKFIEDRIEKFLRKMHDNLEADGKLRVPGGKNILLTRRLEHCIEDGDLDKAFECLKKFINMDIEGGEKERINDQIRLNSGRYNNLQRTKASIREEDYLVERHRIQDSVLTIVKDMKVLLGG